MLTQFFQSINWVDVAMAVLFIRVVFVSVKTGFIAELFRFFGVFTAVFVSLHYYAYLYALVSEKTTFRMPGLEFLFFVGLWGLVVLGFKLLNDGISMLFKAETTHQGFDKYAGGILGGGRAVFVCSLAIFALMLIQQPLVHQQTLKSFSLKAIGKAAPSTYKFVYDHVIGKLFEGQKYNASVFAVVGSHGVDPK